MALKFRLTLFLIVVAIAVVLAGCAKAADVDEATEENAGQTEAAVAESGKLTISFDFDRQEGSASNQFAVWIEDMDGNFVKTIYATRFIASGGYQARPQAIPEWVELSGLKATGESDFDATTGATPAPGTVSFELALDGGPDGEVIPPGEYRFFVEGSLRWSNRVIYSGEIELGGPAPITVQGEPEFIFTDSEEQPALTAESEESAMIGPVTASYTPAG